MADKMGMYPKVFGLLTLGYASYKVKLIWTKKNYWAYYPSDDKYRPSTTCMLWKIKYVPKQISQKTKTKNETDCAA